MPSGWINKTGLNFQENIWFTGKSIYVDKDGIFFFAPKGETYDNFEELADKCLIQHMPFSSIINYDFKEYIEYEPVFYIKYHYTKYSKLYSNHLIVREKAGKNYFSHELDRKLQISKPKSIQHLYIKLKIWLNTFLKDTD